MSGYMENLPHSPLPLRQTPGSLLRRSRKGREFNIRPFLPADEKRVAEFLGSLSASTLLKRYFVGYNALSETAIDLEISRLNRVRQDNGSVLVVTIFAEGKEEIVGMGEMIPLEDLYQTAELAVTVRDDYQGEGLGSSLMSQLVREAVKKGITILQAETLAYNRPMLQIWTKLGLQYSFHTSQSVTSMVARLVQPETMLKGA